MARRSRHAAALEDAPLVPDTQATISDCGPHDLAVTKLMAPATVVLSPSKPLRTVPVKVQIQNRSPNAETIADAATLAAAVHLDVRSLGACADPSLKLHDGKPQKPLPTTLKPKQKLNVVFDVTFDCANDPARSTGDDPSHADDVLTASVNQLALGGTDAHPIDEVCPRQVPPPGVVDPFPDGTLVDKGCGRRKPDKTFGADVLVDVVGSP